MSVAAVAPAHPGTRQQLMVALLRALKRSGYRFVTPSNATHRRRIGRSAAGAKDTRGVLGWSQPFERQVISPRLFDLLEQAGLLRQDDGRLLSAIRVSSLNDDLFLHSAFPTSRPDSVFFGPDTYRFANFLREELRGEPSAGVVIDVGAGAGAGAVTAARWGRPARLILTDTNAKALELAAANLAAAGVIAELLEGSGLEPVGEADLIVANPPFIAGASGHAYRDGGGLHGSAVSLDWALAAVPRLRPGGRLLMYTAAAVLDGVDEFREQLAAQIRGQAVTLDYREIDPDIYGGLLATPAYHGVERIAAVGVSLRRR